MNGRTYEHPKKTNSILSKKLFILSLVIAGSLAANSAYSQVRVEAHIGVGVPAPVIYENDYPGYTYYTYPAWQGHYHDRFYYDHYRPVFERQHRVYFNGRHFDHERFEHENHWHEGRGPGRGDHERGDHGGEDHHRDDHRH
ncbi:MAG TPA: hypothetical protein VF939_04410 [Puia sp.]